MRSLLRRFWHPSVLASLMLVLTTSCSSGTPYDQKLAAAAKLVEDLTASCRTWPDGPARHCVLPKLQQALYLLRHSRPRPDEKPVFVAAFFLITKSAEHGGYLDLVWLESGFDVKGFYMIRNDREQVDFCVLEHYWTKPARDFSESTVLRDVRVGVWTAGERDEPVLDGTFDGRRPQVRIRSATISSKGLRIGLILRDGRHQEPIQSCVVRPGF